ncbi:MAG TPA: hypothetical protein VFU29_12235 [Chitinophagaceae bacterium]|nr:hypothetical protein [Chitinophagaceae bacterium]
MNVTKSIIWPLVLFLIGLLIRFIGMINKIRHRPGTDELVMLGYIVCGIAVIFLLIKLTFRKKIWN